MQLFLGGDYKFMLKILGVSGPTFIYACAWCKIHKDNRWDTSYNAHHYCSSELRGLWKKSKSLYCCINSPLLNIELNHVVLDKL